MAQVIFFSLFLNNLPGVLGLNKLDPSKTGKLLFHQEQTYYYFFITDPHVFLITIRGSAILIVALLEKKRKEK